MINRLVLGTAQFGMSYGISNKTGQTSSCEAVNILQHATSVGIDTLDTAIAYGDAEQMLGNYGMNKWKVISKLPPIPKDCADVIQWVNTIVEKSLKSLRIKQLHGLLLHNPSDLLEERRDELKIALKELKSRGLVNKVGISIYNEDSLNEIICNNQIDIVQAPVNILDRRLVDLGWFTKLTSENIEIHARSVFLQGLLLMAPLSRPKKFNRWNDLWSVWYQWLGDFKLTPVQACLGYVFNQLEINRVIVGINSLEQLKEITSAVDIVIPEIPSEFNCVDIDLINPSRW